MLPDTGNSVTSGLLKPEQVARAVMIRGRALSIHSLEAGCLCNRLLLSLVKRIRNDSPLVAAQTPITRNMASERREASEEAPRLYFNKARRHERVRKGPPCHRSC
jgi:hypothetical protein